MSVLKERCFSIATIFVSCTCPSGCLSSFNLGHEDGAYLTDLNEIWCENCATGDFLILI